MKALRRPSTAADSPGVSDLTSRVCCEQDEFMHENNLESEEFQGVLTSVRQAVTFQRAVQSMRAGDTARHAFVGCSPSIAPISASSSQSWER